MKITVIRVLLILFVCIPSVMTADWGKTGHRAVGEIANYYLSKKARKSITKLLDGQSLAQASTFADEIKSDDAYRMYNPWHYVNFPLDKNYEEETPSSDGDLVQGIEKCIAEIKSPNTSKEEKVFYLKMLVHFYGDLHQPLHVGISEDKGGNSIQVQWFSESSNLHRVWDSDLIAYYGMSYSELSNNLVDKLTKQEVKVLQSHSVLDCVAESRSLVQTVYQSAENGERLGYEYGYHFIPVLLEQVQKGGVRLAGVLNDLFG